MSEYSSRLPLLIESNGCILNNKEEIRILQKFLSEFVHASTCKQSNIPTFECCVFFCCGTKIFLNHMNGCTLEYECPQMCYKSRFLFNHWNKCINDDCQLCWHVRKNLTKIMCDDSMQNYNQNPVNFPFQKEKTEIFDLTFDGNKKANSSFTDNSQHFASTTFTNSTTNYQSESNSNLNLQLLSPPPAKIRILTEPLNNYNNSMPSSSSQGFNTPHVRMCRKCSFHGQKNPYKNHTSCPYKFCICSECQILNARKQKRKDFYNRFDLSLQVPKLDLTKEKAFESLKNDSLKIRHEDKVEWIQYTNDLDKGFLVEGGKTNTGVISYIGRGYHNGHLLPTAIFPSTNPNNIALFKSTLNGNVYHLVNCEALIIADFEWKKNEMGKIPSNAVFCGIVNDDFQYVGRALYNESIIIGRVSKESGCLYILYGNEEILIQSFEVLVDKNNDNTLTEEVSSQPSFDVPTKPSRSINENQCTICFESPVVGIFKECMHACLCADCIDIVNRKKEYNGKVMCPICRKLNDKAEKFFMV